MKMKNILIYGLMFTILFLSAGNLFSKKLTYKQVYLREGSTGFKTLPFVSKWVDSKHYLQSEKNKDGKRITYIVNAVNGKKKVYSKKKTSKLDLKKNKMINATPSPDNKFIAFTRDRNLFVKNIKSGIEQKITKDGSDKIFNAYASWIYYEEVLGRRSRYKAFWWSPDSKKIVFMRFDNNKVPNFTLVRSRGVHGEVEVTAYPKPGDPNPTVKMGVYDLKHNKLLWLNTGKEEDKYIAFPKWNPESTKLFYQELNRGQDNLKIHNVDLNTGKTNLIYQEKQEAWVEFFDDIYILKKNKGFILRSDKDGWRHLYHYSMKGELINRITKGNWRVRSIKEIDEKANIVYFTGFNKESTNNHLFRVKLNGTGLKQISKIAGYHRFKISPKYKYYIDSYSNISNPSKIELYKMNGKFKRMIRDSRPIKKEDLNLGKAEMLRIPAEDGVMLPAKWILPPNFDKNKKYPVLISVYGGPNSASVYNTYNRLGNYYLAGQGIITLSVDHRGSGHFGKKMVAKMHRKLGTWEMKDYISTVKWLRTKSFVDAGKIAITGGSYGGYVTCLALTKGAEYFTHGIALFSVTDWKLYDSIYTERFMDTPKENPEGYKNSTIMNYADKLKGKLLIVHGEMDDNVHPQNSIQLVSKLQDLDKDFEFMLYPNGRHGWRGKKRVHLIRQSVKFWFKHLLDRNLDINKD